MNHNRFIRRLSYIRIIIISQSTRGTACQYVYTYVCTSLLLILNDMLHVIYILLWYAKFSILTVVSITYSAGIVRSCYD